VKLKKQTALNKEDVNEYEDPRHNKDLAIEIFDTKQKR